MAYYTRLIEALNPDPYMPMRSQNEPQPSAQRDLAEEIHHLTEYLKVVHTTRRRFWYGLVAGIGAAIGASILAAPLLYLLSKALMPLGLDISA